MSNKQWHRDRIDELIMGREKYLQIQKIIIPSILGLGGLFLAMTAVYFPKLEQYSNQIIIGGVITLTVIFILAFLDFLAKKNESHFNRKIKKI